MWKENKFPMTITDQHSGWWRLSCKCNCKLSILSTLCITYCVNFWPHHWHNSEQNWKYEIWLEMQELGLRKLQIFVWIFLQFFSLYFWFSLLFLRLPLTGWCAQCTLTLSDIGNALLSYSTRFPSNALFHLSFWNAKQISFLRFLWFLSLGVLHFTSSPYLPNKPWDPFSISVIPSQWRGNTNISKQTLYPSKSCHKNELFCPTCRLFCG